MKNIYHHAITVALIVLCIYLWRGKKYSEKVSTNNIETLTSDIKEFKTKQGLWASEKQAFQGTEKDLKQIIKSKDEAFQKLLKTFKKPVAAAVIKTVTEIDTVFIPYEKKFELPEFNLDFNADTKHYTIHGTSTNKGVNIWDISIPNTLNLVIGKKRTGFLKYGYKINVENSNPNIKTTNLDGFDFQPKPKRFGLGIFVGYSTELEVVIGVGVFYNPISF